MSPFQKDLAAAGIAPGSSGTLTVCRGALFGHPRLGESHRTLSRAVTVIRAPVAQAPAETTLAAPAEALPKIRIAHRRKLSIFRQRAK